MEYKNPKPIAVAVVPAYDPEIGMLGVLLIRRTDEKYKGMLALPAGYMELGETWQQSVVRELQEETGIVATADQVVLHHVATSPLNGNLQVFGCLPKLLVNVRELKPTPEASDYELTGPRTLFRTEFTTHVEAVRLYFERRSSHYAK